MAETARRIRSTRSAEPLPFAHRSTVGSAGGQVVDLRPLKAIAERLSPQHPYRVILLGEPDEIPWEDYATKMPVWFRLVSLRED